MFLKGEPTMWIERITQLCGYRWNKSRSLLEGSFRSFGTDWDRRPVNEFWNSIDNSSEGGFGRCENADPSNALGRDAEDDGSDSVDDEEDLEEEPEEEADRTETQSRV